MSLYECTYQNHRLKIRASCSATAKMLALESLQSSGEHKSMDWQDISATLIELNHLSLGAL